jgi:hypothetical protein
MARLIIDGGTLTASLDDRTVSGLLVPFGEVCKSNLGQFSVGPGAFELPEDVGVLNATLDHDREQPVARFVHATEERDGIRATFRVAKGAEGDALLAEQAKGHRRSLSVEARGVVVRAGRAITGKVFGASFVEAGAFPSATLFAALEDDDQPTTQITDGTVPPDDADESAKEDTTMDEDEVQDADSTETADGSTLTAALPGSLTGPKRGPAKKEDGASLFASLRGKNVAQAGTLLAALDVMNAADVLSTQQQQWLGEVYGSRTYVRRFAPLVQHADLQGLKGLGWKFTAGKTPVVAPYTAGAQPNSNEVKTEAVTLDATRLASAGSVDRAWIDFPSPEFWAGYFREQSNSYDRVLDGIARDAMVAGATAVAAGAVPSGVSTAAAFIVDGALAVLAAERDLPSFAIVGSNLYRDLLLTRADDVIAFLTAAIGLEDGTLAGFRIVPSAAAGLASKVLVGTRTAATVYELPGSPVRVDAVSISNGQVDRGLFGYHAELINDAQSLALVAAA